MADQHKIMKQCGVKEYVHVISVCPWTVMGVLEVLTAAEIPELLRDQYSSCFVQYESY